MSSPGIFARSNQDNKQAILHGFKNKIQIDECMTGKEFCSLSMEIDYNEIVVQRQKDQHENMVCFIKELLKIDEVKSIVNDLLDSNG